MAGDVFGIGAVGFTAGVSSASEITSQVGIDILKAGGNAVDAAVATIFAVGVVEPNLSGIGGPGMMVIYLKDTNEYVMLEYMGTVPSALQPGMFIPAVHGNTAMNATVPGSVHGLLTALERYGTMSRQQVMAPAIRLAREGFPLYERLSAGIMDNYDFISNSGAANVYLDDGFPFSVGNIIRNPELADVLEAISRGGIDEFYRGRTAQRIVDGLRAGGSLITMQDMASYSSILREPIRTTYYGYEVVTVPPPSNGGFWLLKLLNLLEYLDIAQYEPNSPEYIYWFNEANRLAVSDAFVYIGDPAFFNLPTDIIVSKDYARQRAAHINRNMQAMEFIPEAVLPFEAINTDSNTTHVSIIDQFGNIVSQTNTLGLMWGNKFAIEGMGFFFNSHVANLNHTNPESPDFVAPGKRVRSTITPSMVLQRGEPIMAIGSPGSLAIPPAIAKVINNVLLYDMDLQAAINFPRAMAISRSLTTGPTRAMTIEAPRFSQDVLDAITGMGYTIQDVGEFNMAVGGIAVIYVDRQANVVFGGADPRRNYRALAY
jgi:gamma-glutamyltranspeptidase/glutathione hydrolase